LEKPQAELMFKLKRSKSGKLESCGIKELKAEKEKVFHKNLSLIRLLEAVLAHIFALQRLNLATSSLENFAAAGDF
jgi:hypothetical protein